MLHDAGRSLGAKHALVDRVIPVAFYVMDLAFGHVDIDAAAAGAHVTGGLANLGLADSRARSPAGLVHSPSPRRTVDRLVTARFRLRPERQIDIARLRDRRSNGPRSRENVKSG
jgi:hypothetical protein